MGKQYHYAVLIFDVHLNIDKFLKTYIYYLKGHFFIIPESNNCNVIYYKNSMRKTTRMVRWFGSRTTQEDILKI